MGELLVASMVILTLLSLPLIAASFAKRMGRSPMKWFLIGLILPGIASVILFCLPDLSEDESSHPASENKLA